MVRYIKCPRCELNYIDADKQEYCDVCIAEMKGNKLQFADLEDEELEEELDAENTELCPVCGVNRIHYGETMCESCRRKSEYEEEEEIDPDKDEEWKSYLDDDMEDLTIDDEELAEELKAEGEEDEVVNTEPDDFDDDPLAGLAADDFDDEDDWDDDDDDDDLF